MHTLAVTLIVLSAVLTGAANLMLRHGLLKAGGLVISIECAGALLGQPWFMTGVFLYGLAALIWFRVLSITELSGAYPVLVGLTFCLVTVGAIVWFKESVGVLKMTGIAMILVGIIIVGRT